MLKVKKKMKMKMKMKMNIKNHVVIELWTNVYLAEFKNVESETLSYNTL